MTTPPKTVLILCTGNSCRSQMAEALINHDLAGLVHAVSAGTSPQPKVADGALEALRLAGIPTAGLTPKDVDVFLDQDLDLVVTVCDNAKESCPIFPRPVRGPSICPSTTPTASLWRPSWPYVTTSAPA
jgi:arsenate reductase